MSLRRLFAAQLPEAQTQLALSEESRHHAQVLRLAAGDEVELFDAVGGRAQARVVRCDRRVLVCDVEPRQHVVRQGAVVTLMVCVPKASKLELIVRMATELGVAAIELVHSERAVPKFGSDAPKLERLRRIALEACAQSEQAYAPELRGPLPLAAAVEAVPPGACKLACLERSALSPWPALDGAAEGAWLTIGPEGGFTSAERELLARAGYRPISLGDSVLRVETACVVGCALLLDRLRRP